MLAEDPVEIADIFISHGQGDVGYPLAGVGQQPGRLPQPPLLQKLRVGPARAALDLPAEPGHIAVEALGCLGQASAGVVVLQILQLLVL